MSSHVTSGITPRATFPAPAATPAEHSPDLDGARGLPAGGSSPSRARRLWRGRDTDPAWARPALLGLLALTAFLYLWSLGDSGWGNSFYAAAAQAGSESWKAFFFGSSDAGNAITVDKTPLALWPMALTVRVFGLSSWSILVPQALEGVAAVWLLTATVRRTTGSAAAGLLAGLVLATTPVAVLMFRFDNPDALLLLLVIGAVAATLQALSSPHAVRWVALGGALVGLGFLTKMLQAFLVLPALALVYVLFAQAGLGKRVLHLLVALASMVVSAGWWIAVVSLWPASSRPYIGGSQTNSILELTLGYNGFGRLTGNETGSVGGGGGGGGSWGETGILRMFGSDMGGQVAWLLPAALVLLVGGLWLGRRAARTDAVRAGLVVWGTLLLVTGLTFSFMAGIFHAYYTVALAPGIAALVGIGAWQLWQHRTSLVATFTGTAAMAATAVLAFALLGRTPDFVPWLRWVVLVVGLLAAVALAALRFLPGRLAAVVAGVALLAALAGPAAYAVDTVATPHTGSIVTAGPSTGAGAGGPGGGRGGFGGTTQGQAGGLLNGSTSTAAITALLQDDADSYTWAAAAVGSNTAAGYQLASQEPVMAIGGFNGSDPSPTLEQFEQDVADGQVHWFIAGGGFGGQQNGGSSASSEIAAWVEATFTAQTVDGVTLYDLTTPAGTVA
jgi:4-amino-4-deoxy-L-arabinose transferase-like glycosyltransferase